MNIGTACKRIAKSKRISAAEISRVTGISQSYLSMLFNGRIDDPQLKKMYLIAHALDMGVDEIIEYAMKDEECPDVFSRRPSK
jgi:transcriptional regulator with XRE-family HTH domain